MPETRLTPARRHALTVLLEGARSFEDGLTLEVNRTVTAGTHNANSMLYGAAWRAAKALGYRRLVTYTQAGDQMPRTLWEAV